MTNYRNKGDRVAGLIALLFMAAVFVVCACFGVAEAQQQPYTVYQTIPGTNITDYQAPRLRVEPQVGRGWTATPTIPGTGIKDYTAPRLRLQQDRY